ncbi:hypothetical protein LJC47_06320 [Desulfosarcina sp. OttesenSCG-928-B08]|nr:hypothetical protein [Desulfosarcina sp. OttesenSCG-928-B08]
MDSTKKNKSTVIYFDELGFGWLMNADQMEWLQNKEIAEQEWDQRVLSDAALPSVSVI